MPLLKTNLARQLNRKLHHLIIFIGFSTIILNNSCTTSSETKVIEISYERKGGLGGFFDSLQIRKDSTFYKGRYFSESSESIISRSEIKSFSEQTDSILWKELINLLDLNSFNKVKSGRKRAYIDGVDTYLDVKTNRGVYSIINGWMDTTNNYVAIKPLVDRIELLTNKYRNKSNR